MENLRIVSFFAGCGGLDLGFEQAGFSVVWANEFEPAVRDTYVYNHPNTEFCLADLNTLSPNDIPDCEGFIGGPPCQSWSVAGKQRGLDDQRGQLFITYIDMIKAKKPKFFVIENVRGLLDDKFKDVFEDFLTRLSEAGYSVQYKLLDAVYYGVPQNRERVFLVGFRKDLNVEYSFPKATTEVPKTLKDSISDIVDPQDEYLTEDFGDFYNRGNRRRPWDRPSFTIHATASNIPLHPSSPKMLCVGHEDWKFQEDKMPLYRRLSIRECARIQTFPDTFRFISTDLKATYKMIGNAVPPMLAKAIAVSIKQALQQVTPKPINTERLIDSNNPTVLVGYYKSEEHLQKILERKIYYVRADGRRGSMFPEDCDVIPEYLLLHDAMHSHLYHLVLEDPFLATADFLEKEGFAVHGEHYLCFRLDSEKEIDLSLLFTTKQQLPYENHYAPYWAKLNDLL